MILYQNASECCACGACISSCPQKAISFRKDQRGFLYPIIDQDKCVECGLCVKVCHFKSKVEKISNSSDCYFATSKDSNFLMKSSSGGVFPLLARKILKESGIVFGAKLEKKDSGFTVEHIAISSEEDLPIIQGSKYVFSNTKDTFTQVFSYLKKGKKVLYCGTPCQIAGLKSFLKRDYDRLYTIDLVCHGVPSLEMFNSFIDFYQSKKHIDIENVSFREKIHGIDSTSLFYIKFTSKLKEYKKFCKLVSYYGYFLDGDLYQESCYECKYACPNRVGDITLGDGWGIEKYYPEVLKKNGGKIEHSTGISTILVNTKKGKELFSLLEEELFTIKTNFEAVSKYNHQLKSPTVKKNDYEKLMDLYSQHGYAMLDRMYFQNMNLKDKIYFGLYLRLKTKISSKLRNYIKLTKG